jgi:tRNA uracil 4-sulfurtransferase
MAPRKIFNRGLHHTPVDVILVRYAEVGLKSTGLRRYFESILIDNMLTALASHGLEALVTSEQGRIYVTTDRITDALPVIRRVFGVASVSPALIGDSAMEEMQRLAADYSRKVLRDGQSFAVKARREGNHPYKSMDVGREVGSAIFLANEERGVKVDLTRPDVTFYVEVRDKKAYLFSEYLSAPGGLPMGSQGKVVAVVENDRDALAAWLLMKRGCRVIVHAPSPSAPFAVLKAWDPKLKAIISSDLSRTVRESKALAVVYGRTLQDMEAIKALPSDPPAFFPLLGLEEDDISAHQEMVRLGL